MEKNRRGQTALEVAMLMPFFLMMAYALLQIGYLSIGVTIVTYAASSVARQAVAENYFNKADAEIKFNNLLTGGLKSADIRGTTVPDGEGTSNLRVTACAEIPSFPLAGKFLAEAFKSTTPPGPDACAGPTRWFGPVGVTGPPYHFIIEGQAVARMNYHVGK